MTSKAAVGYITIILLTVTAGELVVDRSPCPGQSAIFRCNVHNEDLVWRWQTDPPRQFVVASNIQPSSTMRTSVMGGVQVVFNISEYRLNPSVISAVAIVSDPDVLNGVAMTCGGQSLVIRVSQTSFVPTALQVVRVSHNESEINIYPIGDFLDNTFYQLSSTNPVAWTGPIKLCTAENITFLYCQLNSTFFIDMCILEDSNIDRNYTLFVNGTWVISQKCDPPEIQVTCVDGSWSEDITCQEITSDQNTSIGETTATTEANSFVTVKSATTIKDNFVTGSTSCTDHMYSLRSIIGTAIGCFMLALIVGIGMGLLSGVIYNKKIKVFKHSGENCNCSKHSIDLHKRQFHEDVEVEKKVELTQNVCYDTVKRI